VGLQVFFKEFLMRVRKVANSDY